MISGIITIILVSLILIGMALGMLRGFTKSWVRLIIVVCGAVISYFVAGAIGNAIAKINISSMGINIGGETATTVSNAVELVLKDISVVGELVQSSPTIASVITVLPIAIINLILFDLLFFLINFITWIIYLIIFAIVRKKHKDEEKPKRKGLGVLMSVIQSVFVFVVIFVPVMGLTYFVNKQIDYANNYNGELEQTSIEGSVSADEYYNEMVAFAEEKSAEEEKNTTDATEQVEKYAKDLTDVWVFKTLKFLGYDRVSMALTNNLTKFEVNNVKTGLFDEFENVVKISVRVERLFGNNRQISSWTTDDVKILNEVVNKFFDSPIFGDITTELVNAGAKKWTEASENNKFLGVEKPQTSSDVQAVLDELLIGLKTDNKEDLKGEFNSIVNAINCLIEKDVMKLISKSADITSFIDPIKNSHIIADVLTSLSTGNALNRALPKVIQLGLNQMYKAVNVPEEDYNKLKINVSSSQINWNTESEILDELFSNLAKVYESIQKEGDIKDNLDYDSLAVALERMRDCNLLAKSTVKVIENIGGIDVESTSPLNKELTITLLRNSSMKDIDGMNSVINDIELNYNAKDANGNYKLSFKTLLNTLKYSVKLATDLKNAETINTEDVAGLLDGLKDEVVGEIVKDAVKEKLEKEIEKAGIEADVTGTTAVSNIVDAVTDYNKTANENNSDPTKDKLPTLPTEKEEIIKTAESAKTMFDVIKKGEGADESAETKYFATKEELQNFIKEMHKSNYLWNVSLRNSDKLGFKDVETNTTKLTEKEYQWATELLTETYTDGEADVAYYTDVEMQNIFGLNK